MVETAPVSQGVVRRFVAGTGTGDAVAAATRLLGDGLAVTLDHLGEDCVDQEHARQVKDAYVLLLDRLAEAGLTRGVNAAGAEVSVKLSAVGQALPQDGRKIALEYARDICSAARRAGTTVTLDMEDHTTTDDTLEALRELRADFPWVGAVLQSYLKRTEADCRDLAGPGSRIRLCKGAYNEPSAVAFQDKAEVDKSYVRCVKTLLRGQGYPMFATHDPRLIDIVGALAIRGGKPSGSYEFQMLYGIRPDEQRRLAGLGELVRVYVPYGSEWYGYLMRRLAERPANLAFFARSLISKG
ncbi:MAG TPA: proline dehydrogenase family protein [Actinocrinis sp.]|nr:proline dehydrogenase family protein [Actinocrinis sp.]